MPDDLEVYEPEYVKYLGVYFDNHLSFNRHIDVVNCKVNRIVGILWKNTHLTLEAKKTIYFVLVESHINYGILTWASVFSKCINNKDYGEDYIPMNLLQLVRTQNKIIRAIFRKPKFDKKTQTHVSVTPLYKSLGILKLKDLYLYNLAIMAHDFFYNNCLPDSLADKFDRKCDATQSNTRSAPLDLYYRTPKLSYTYRKPTIAASAFWNYLPTTLRSIKARNTFKIELKKFLISSY